jgi:hypothetical protein
MLVEFCSEDDKLKSIWQLIRHLDRKMGSPDMSVNIDSLTGKKLSFGGPVDY